jgi:hypothetical protein
MTIEVMKQTLEALEQITSPLHVSEAIRIGTAQAALRQAISQPDCRGCEHSLRSVSGKTLIKNVQCDDCTNGDKFQALPKVVLYKVT